MWDGFILVAVIIGGSYAIYYGTRFLLRVLFKRKPQTWVTRNYKKHSSVDLDKVDKVVASGILPDEEFSHWEMVAVFGSLLLTAEVPDVIRKAEVFGNQGWSKNYSYDFYDEVARMAKKISAQHYKKSARELIMFGQRLAEMYGERNWVEQYRKILDEQLAEQANMEWDATRL